MVNALQDLGFEMGASETPIIPIYIRDNFLTFKFTQRLFEEGIFVNPVVSPAVKSDSSLIRMSIMATHTKEQLDTALEKLQLVANELNIARHVSVA
jgi:8-amino-7-oxononanoate synthase